MTHSQVALLIWRSPTIHDSKSATFSYYLKNVWREFCGMWTNPPDVLHLVCGSCSLLKLHDWRTGKWGWATANLPPGLRMWPEYNERMTDMTIEEIRRQLLAKLSSVEYDYKHRNLIRMRHPGTGAWLADKRDFKNWKEEQRSSCLCCYGIRRLPNALLLTSLLRTNWSWIAPAGSGKTILAYVLHCLFYITKTWWRNMADQVW